MAPKADFRPIIPKKNPFPNVAGQQAKLFAILASIGHQGSAELSKYPTAGLARVGRQGGSATSYRRTGELGRKWTVEGPKNRGDALLVRVGNNAAHAPFVQGPTKGSGPHQRDLFKNLGWSNVTDVSKEVFDRHKAAIVKVLQGG